MRTRLCGLSHGRIRKAIAPILALFFSACASSPAAAQGLSTGEFRVYWGGHSGNVVPGERWQDWAADIQFPGVTVHRNFAMLYEHEITTFPQPGLHIAAADPGWMDRHRAKVREQVPIKFPDANMEGYGCFDFETWVPVWRDMVDISSPLGPNALDKDFRHDWRDFIRETRPGDLAGLSLSEQEALFERTFNDAAREFWVATLEEARAVRPRIKWGYYGFPPRNYYAWHTPERVAAHVERHRADYAWMYEASDVLYPDSYQILYTVPENADWRRYENLPDENRVYMLGNTREAVHVAAGKPVIAFIWYYYHDTVRNRPDTYLNEINIRDSFVYSKEGGADGVVMWQSINSDAEFLADQAYINEFVIPQVRDTATDNPLSSPPPPPPPGGGSGGSGSGSAGGSGSGGSPPSGGGVPPSSPSPSGSGSGGSTDSGSGSPGGGTGDPSGASSSPSSGTQQPSGGTPGTGTTNMRFEPSSLRPSRAAISIRGRDGRRITINPPTTVPGGPAMPSISDGRSGLNRHSVAPNMTRGTSRFLTQEQARAALSTKRNLTVRPSRATSAASQRNNEP